MPSRSACFQATSSASPLIRTLGSGQSAKRLALAAIGVHCYWSRLRKSPHDRQRSKCSHLRALLSRSMIFWGSYVFEPSFGGLEFRVFTRDFISEDQAEEFNSIMQTNLPATTKHFLAYHTFLGKTLFGAKITDVPCEQGGRKGVCGSIKLVRTWQRLGPEYARAGPHGVREISFSGTVQSVKELHVEQEMYRTEEENAEEPETMIYVSDSPIPTDRSRMARCTCRSKANVKRAGYRC